MAGETRKTGRGLGGWPWITLIVAALLGGGAAWMYSGSVREVAHFEERRAEVRQYFDEHLYLTLDREVGSLLESAQFDRRRIHLKEWSDAEDSGASAASPVSESRRRYEEAQLTLLVNEASEARRGLPTGRYGVTSTSDAPSRFLLHAAAHETGVALCITLMILLLAGMALENAWGHVIFAIFCAASTAGVAWLRASTAGPVDLPWAGSGGLAAALIGGYMALTLRGHASYYGGMLSGWLLLPLWAGAQYALIHHAWEPGFDHSLFFVHGAGAAAGFAFATLVSAFGLERRADGSVQHKPSSTAQTIGRARRARNNGQAGEAFELLRVASERSPGDPELVSTLWGLAKELGQESIAAPAVMEVARRALRENRPGDAVNLWMDLVAAGCCDSAQPLLLVRIGEVLLDEGHPNEALDAMRRAAEAEGLVPADLALRIVKVARDLDPDLTRVSAKLALADPSLPKKKRAEMNALATAAASAMARPHSADHTEHGEPAADARPPAPASTPTPVQPIATPSAPIDTSAPEVEALDPGALSEDALTADVEDARIADAAEIERWNDPGLLEDLSAEVGDADFDEDPTDTLALDLLPHEFHEGVDASPDLDATQDDPLEPVDTAVQFDGRRVRLRVVSVVPVAFEDRGVVLEVVGQGKTTLGYRRIEAVSVGAVEGISAKPVIVVDLVLNWRSFEGEELRVLRIRCDSFDPRSIVEAASPLESLMALLEELLTRSGAAPLPDVQAARGKAFARFASLAAYEADVLGATPDPH